MWSLYFACQLLLSRARPWSVVETLSGISLEKRDFPLPRRYQLLVASWFEVGPWAHILFPIRFCLIWGNAGLVHTTTVSVSSYVCRSCCVEKTLFLWSHPPSLDFIVFPPPLPHTSLILRVRVWMETSHLWLSAQKSLILSRCKSLFSLVSNTRKIHQFGAIYVYHIMPCPINGILCCASFCIMCFYKTSAHFKNSYTFSFQNKEM